MVLGMEKFWAVLLTWNGGAFLGVLDAQSWMI